jgi:hypothetical protein
MDRRGKVVKVREVADELKMMTALSTLDPLCCVAVLQLELPAFRVTRIGPSAYSGGCD